MRSGDIVGIFDMDNTTISKWTKKFLSNGEKKGQVISVTTDLPKTFVVVKRQAARGKKQDTKIYLSQISSATLRKRTGYSYTSRQY